MVNAGAQKLARLIVTVPKTIAEPYGAALIELGAEAVEERPTRNDDIVEIVLIRPANDPLEPWQNAARNVYEVFVDELQVPWSVFTVKTEAYELDYHDAWLKHLSLVQLTPDIVLSPVSDETATPDGHRRLLYTPQPAFGDGSHVTTRLAATAIEAYCNAHPGCRLLDVGTGNGVLSLVCAACGGFALGIDIDEMAVKVAEDNAKTNRLTEQCRFSTLALAELTNQFELTVANLEPLTQLEQSCVLCTRVAPGKTLLLTGFLEEQAASIQAPYVANGFTVEETVSNEGYVLLRLSAPNRVTAEAY